MRRNDACPNFPALFRAGEKPIASWNVSYRVVVRGWVRLAEGSYAEGLREQMISGTGGATKRTETVPREFPRLCKVGRGRNVNRDSWYKLNRRTTLCTIESVRSWSGKWRDNTEMDHTDSPEYRRGRRTTHSTRRVRSSCRYCRPHAWWASRRRRQRERGGWPTG